MTSIAEFSTDDFFRFQHVNLDIFTENFGVSFYLQYLATWPDLCYTAEGPDKRVAGYMYGKAEGNGKEWHGHVTAVTVGPQYRRCGLAKLLMNELEERSDKIFDGYFVDLYVRVSNTAAVEMYKGMGYTVYRTVLQYYDGNEDAYDMRRPLSRDVGRHSLETDKRVVTTQELRPTM
eukprot:CAMPEP_0113871952 /NCGR_PEP_ID=MMETSP0780_2-20120614/2930_1 /TAXON_ID=652834 /ORGANISM="Palpitomonas bilix" /LENGTH=175 /DNA_ID=CAMNT_0000857403 /DNA_START=94 /DNA_END=621 /DNA_ORIENTATION=- /assembly_acc=CAM_ASM_000599